MKDKMLRVSGETHKKIKLLATKKGISIKQFLEDYLKRTIKQL